MVLNYLNIYLETKLTIVVCARFFCQNLRLSLLCFGRIEKYFSIFQFSLEYSSFSSQYLLDIIMPNITSSPSRGVKAVTVSQIEILRPLFCGLIRSLAQRTDSYGFSLARILQLDTHPHSLQFMQENYTSIDLKGCHIKFIQS